MTVLKKIAVALWTSGRLADEGAGTWFDEHPRFVCLPFRERSDADVLLFLAPDAAERAIAAMNAPTDGLLRPSVLVADRLSPGQAAQATDRGMARFLDHSVTSLSDVSGALIAAVEEAEAQKTADWPSLTDAQANPSNAMDGGGSGLSAREIEVLRLLAAGSTVAEISARLNYSERTIKGIVHDVVNRFGFKNRVQAVAYGIRMGVL
ncbi:response regulator transcription factor [Promicromonospora sukumoe]|uniref:response regulator transcription factor n=1 Tax=Promicromonospora sukumoe TaxID=88382 RepID=UPI0037C7DE32